MNVQASYPSASYLPQNAISDTAGQFERVFREHYPGLYRYAYVITKAHDVAEEVVNDVFLKFWSGGGEKQVHSSVKSFLVRATRNHAIDQLRKHTRQRNRWRELVGDFCSAYDEPHEILVGGETNQLIEAAIAGLSPQRRRIFKMSREEQMTYGEIARELNLSVKTVEAHMGGSLKHLRTALREQGVF